MIHFFVFCFCVKLPGSLVVPTEFDKDVMSYGIGLGSWQKKPPKNILVLAVAIFIC